MAELSFEDIAPEVTPALVRWLRRQTRDHALAEDLLQETLIRIARGLPSFDGRSSVKTWCFAIAARVAIDHFRRGGDVPPPVELSEVEEVPDGAPTPESLLSTERMNECVRQVIDDLPPDYREAILLHHFKGLTAREAAEACGCSEANAKVRIHRGRARLRQALEKECELYRDADNVLRCARKGAKP